jgi:hypothetical protein
MRALTLLRLTLCLLIKGDRTGVFPLLLNAGFPCTVDPLKQWRYRETLARRPASPHKAISSRCLARSLICRSAPKVTDNDALALGYLARDTWAGYPNPVPAPCRAGD